MRNPTRITNPPPDWENVVERCAAKILLSTWTRWKRRNEGKAALGQYEQQSPRPKRAASELSDVSTASNTASNAGRAQSRQSSAGLGGISRLNVDDDGNIRMGGMFIPITLRGQKSSIAAFHLMPKDATQTAATARAALLESFRQAVRDEFDLEANAQVSVSVRRRGLPTTTLRNDAQLQTRLQQFALSYELDDDVTFSASIKGDNMEIGKHWMSNRQPTPILTLNR